MAWLRRTLEGFIGTIAASTAWGLTLQSTTYTHSSAAACASYESTARLTPVVSGLPAVQALAVVHNEIARALHQSPRGPVTVTLDLADRWLHLIEAAAADTRTSSTGAGRSSMPGGAVVSQREREQLAADLLTEALMLCRESRRSDEPTAVLLRRAAFVLRGGEQASPRPGK